MKPFDDHDLIAYHMQELAPERRRALERALSNDPALAAESRAFAKVLAAYKSDAPPAFDGAALTRNWLAVRASLAPYAAAPVSAFRWRTPALYAAGAALAAMTFLVAITHRKEALPAKDFSTQASVTPDSSARSATPHTAGSAPSAPLAAPLRGLALHASSEAQLSSALNVPLDAPNMHAPSSSAPAVEPAPEQRFIPPANQPVPTTASIAENIPPSQPATAVPTSAAAAQTDLRSKHARTQHSYPADITLAMGGTLIPEHQTSPAGDDTRAMGATHAVSATAAFHQQLRPAVGYRIALSYTRPDFEYYYGRYGEIENNGRIYELAGTYVVQGPHSGRLSTTVEAGAGVMGILPTLPNPATSANIRAAGIAGVSAEITLTRHLALHAAYRAQVFKGPDFNGSSNFLPLFSATLFSNEPSAGITYRFHPK